MTPSSPATKQVATRVSADAWRVLQVGLLVEGRATVQDLLRPVVEEYAQRLYAEPEVRAILEEADRYEGRKRGVTRLDRGTRGGSSRRREEGSKDSS